MKTKISASFSGWPEGEIPMDLGRYCPACMKWKQVSDFKPRGGNTKGISKRCHTCLGYLIAYKKPTRKSLKDNKQTKKVNRVELFS